MCRFIHSIRQVIITKYVSKRVKQFGQITNREFLAFQLRMIKKKRKAKTKTEIETKKNKKESINEENEYRSTRSRDTFNYVHIIDTQHIYIYIHIRINAYIHTHIHARHERSLCTQEIRITRRRVGTILASIGSTIANRYKLT